MPAETVVDLSDDHWVTEALDTVRMDFRIQGTCQFEGLSFNLTCLRTEVNIPLMCQCVYLGKALRKGSSSGTHSVVVL